MSIVNTVDLAAGPEQLDELQAAVDRLVRGRRDPAEIRRACERMDRMRKEMLKRSGEVDVAVGLIREIRDEG